MKVIFVILGSLPSHLWEGKDTNLGHTPPHPFENSLDLNLIPILPADDRFVFPLKLWNV